MKNFYLTLFLFPILIYVGCSGSERYTHDENEVEITALANEVRLLIEESINGKEILIETESILSDTEGSDIQINPGDKLLFSAANDLLTLRFRKNYYESKYFFLAANNSNQPLKYNGFKLRGKLKLLSNRNSISVINHVDIESYIKGVIPKEMPLGKGEENFEALKAFAICARTYTLMKMKREKNFDLYIDTRDQVYGGVDVEKPISNKAVDETKDLILTYNNKPAIVFYHSTCGGKTEDVKNIFGIDTAYYLSGVDDGINPYCSISPSFEWEEVFSSSLFIERLKLAGLVDSLFDVLENIYIEDRFESGRVNELRIELSSSETGEKKSISLFGNNIRGIIRTANNKSILKSIWFDLTLDENKNVIIHGKGYGHGVGLCQWGAVSQSRAGIKFKEILSHYFPGTEISYLNNN